MRYAVLSPDNKLICFDHSKQVAEYCLRVDNDSLDDYCEEEELVYETMTPTEIGQKYTYVGALAGGCNIYYTRDILNVLRENGAEEHYIQEANALFNNRRLNNEIKCPGFLEDILGELTPISPSQMTDGVYFMENIDEPTDEKDNG